MLITRPGPGHHRPGQRSRHGLSIIELLVGVVVGMIVISGALTLFARNLTGSRNLLIETRLNQDLRAAVDLVTRDLRRAGYWGNSIQGTLAISASASAPPNPYSGVTLVSASEVTYRFSQNTENDALDASEQFGFRLNGDALQMQSESGTWTSVTDTSAIKILNFTITESNTALPLGYLCPKTCAVGAPNCPIVYVRSYAILVQGESVKDSSIKRDLRSTVRVRNDSLSGSCPA